MPGLIYHLFSAAVFLNLTRIQHHDMVCDLRDYRKVVCDINGRGAFLLNYRFECLKNFYLGGYIEGSSWLVEHQKIWLTAQRHCGHQPLQLTTGYLVRISPAQSVRIGQFQGAVERLGTFIGLFLVQYAVQNTRLRHLFTDRQGRVERCRCTLCQVSDPLATQSPQLI